MELNPNHTATREAHDHWHKIAALLMVKYGKRTEIISREEIANLGEAGLNLCIRFNDETGIELTIVDDAEAARLARKEGGLPV